MCVRAHSALSSVCVQFNWLKREAKSRFWTVLLGVLLRERILILRFICICHMLKLHVNCVSIIKMVQKKNLDPVSSFVYCRGSSLELYSNSGKKRVRQKDSKTVNSLRLDWRCETENPEIPFNQSKLLRKLLPEMEP